MKRLAHLFLFLAILTASLHAQDTLSLIETSLSKFDIPNITGTIDPMPLRLGVYTAEVAIPKDLIPKGFPEDAKGYKAWHVMPGSTADRADIFDDDTIIAIDGKPLFDGTFRGDDFLDIYLSSKKSGDPIKITILRNGSALEKSTQLIGTNQVPMAYKDPGLGKIRENTWLDKIIEQFKLNTEIQTIQKQMASVANSDFNKAPYGNHQNPWRLNAVTYLHNFPTRVGAYSRLITDEFWKAEAENGSLIPILQTLSKHLDVIQVDYELLTAKPKDISQLSDYFVKAQLATELAYKGVDNLPAVTQKLKNLLLNDVENAEDEKLKAMTREQKRDYRLKNDNELAKIFDTADKLDFFALTDAAKMLANLIDTNWVNEFIQNLPKEPYNKPVTGVEGDVIYYWENDYGRFVIGGSGTNRYTGDFAFIMDIGGNDVYELPAAKLGTSRMIIDADGDDFYNSKECGQASGVGCIDVLFDVKGNDTYRAVNYSQGSAVLGVGLLADYDGNDVYTSQYCSQGAAFLGIGLLFDLRGMDIYDAYVFSQGFGYAKGIGALMDKNGNDSYRAGWKITDSRDPKRAHLSMSQGYGYGMRPWASAVGSDGGIGILTDYYGHDVYNADFFSQGGSYWFSLGVLHDYHGCDRYTAGQYSQGSGIHLSFGALLDDEGNDMYDAYAGLEQGNAHDWSAGCLEDAEGDDTYRGFGSSQGSALTVAFAWLLDLQGNDMYICNNKDTTYSEGGGRQQKTRKAFSFGMLLDLGKGVDVYTEPRVKPGEAVLKGEKGVLFDDGEEKK